LRVLILFAGEAQLSVPFHLSTDRKIKRTTTTTTTKIGAHDMCPRELYTTSNKLPPPPTPSRQTSSDTLEEERYIRQTNNDI
jgi:hypothetical protein